MLPPLLLPFMSRPLNSPKDADWYACPSCGAEVRVGSRGCPACMKGSVKKLMLSG